MGFRVKKVFQYGVTIYRKYREQISYLFFGGCTTLVNLATYFLLTRLAGTGESFATIIGQILSITFAYVTNKIWVFESKTNNGKELVKEMVSFYGCRGATFLLDLFVVTKLFIEILGYPDVPVKIIGNVAIILLNYLFSKLWIFSKKK